MNLFGAQGSWRDHVILLLLGVCTLVSLYAGFSLSSGIAYTHLYYIPVTLSALWQQKKAILAGLYLFSLHFALEYLRQGVIDPAVLVRGSSLLVLAFVVSTIVASARSDERRARQYQISLGARTAPLGTRLKARFDGFRGLLRTSASIARMEREGNTAGLVSALGDRDPELRYQAALALARLRDAGAAAALGDSLRDSDAGVRWISAIALERMGAQAVRILIEAARDPDPEVRWRAVLALGRAGGEGAIPFLLECLEDGDHYVRDRAAIALGDMGRVAYPACVEALERGSTRAKVGALLALGISGSIDALPCIIERLASGDRILEEGAMRAVTYLHSTAGEMLVEQLILLLRHECAAVRRGAIRALASLRVRGAIPQIGELIRDPERVVAEEAERALDELRRI